MVTPAAFPIVSGNRWLPCRRVTPGSTKKQDTRSQEPELKRWCDAYASGQAVEWYWDEASGKNMERPGWRALDAGIRAGRINRIVCWRLDRLGRTASGLTCLFDDLRDGKDRTCVDQGGNRPEHTCRANDGASSGQFGGV